MYTSAHKFALKRALVRGSSILRLINVSCVAYDTIAYTPLNLRYEPVTAAHTMLHTAARTF
jgi:hypothetical protein